MTGSCLLSSKHEPMAPLFIEFIEFTTYQRLPHPGTSLPTRRTCSKTYRICYCNEVGHPQYQDIGCSFIQEGGDRGGIDEVVTQY